MHTLSSYLICLRVIKYYNRITHKMALYQLKWLASVLLEHKRWEPDTWQWMLKATTIFGMDFPQKGIVKLLVWPDYKISSKTYALCEICELFKSKVWMFVSRRLFFLFSNHGTYLHNIVKDLERETDHVLGSEPHIEYITSSFSNVRQSAEVSI